MRLNPLFIRSQFQRFRRNKLKGRTFFVSIPYSSGLSFRDGVDGFTHIQGNYASQSLIHQVSAALCAEGVRDRGTKGQSVKRN